LSSIPQPSSTYKCTVPKLLAIKWAFIDREPDFRDDNSDVEVWTSCESDVEILCGGENSFSTKNQEIRVDSNGEVLSDKAI